MNNFTQSFLYIERVEKVNIFLFVGLCLIKVDVLNTLGSVKTCLSCEVNVNSTSRWESLHECSLCFKVLRKRGREGGMEGETDWRFLRYVRVTKAEERKKKKKDLTNRSIQAVTF